MADNPDRALVAAALRTGETGVPVRTNPVFADLQASLKQARPGAVALGFALHARVMQGDGVVHGGVISTMLDGSMAFAVLTRLEEGESTATVSLTVNFQRAATAGMCEVEAEVEKVGRQLAFTRACLTQSGKVIATATAALAILRASRSEAAGLPAGEAGT